MPLDEYGNNSLMGDAERVLENPIASPGILSSPADPQGWGLGLAMDDPRLSPGREMIVNEPRELPGSHQFSEGQKIASELRDTFSNLPVFMRMSIAENGGLQSLMGHMMQQRQMQAYRLAQVEEQKRQHEIGLLEKAMTNPRAQVMLQQLGETPGYSMAPQARMMAKAMKEQDYASFDAYKQVIPMEIQQRFVQGQLPYHELTAWIDHAREAVKVNAKEQAKALLVQGAMDKAEDQRTPYERQLVEEHQTALELKKADIDLKKAQAKKAMAEADREPQDRDLGIDREAFTLQLYKGKYGPNVRFRQLAPDEQATVNRAVSGYLGGISRDRIAGSISGEMASPIKDPSQWRRLNERGEIEPPPPMASKEELLRSGFVNISQFDNEMKMIESLPTSISIIDDLQKYAREIIKAGPGLIDRTAQGVQLTIAGKMQAGRPTGIPGADGKPMTLGEVVALYDSTAKGNAEAIARSGGGLSGAATEGDVIRTMENIAKFSDSRNVMEEKFRRFKKLFTDKYDTNMKVVFGKNASKSSTVDDRLDRIEKLLKQGKP